jgi:hypothetical protein
MSFVPFVLLAKIQKVDQMQLGFYTYCGHQQEVGIVPQIIGLPPVIGILS